MSLFSKLFGDPNEKVISEYQSRIAHITSFETDLTKLSDEQVRQRFQALSARAKDGESLDALLPEAFAIVRDAARRTVHMRHFDAQMLGGMVLHDGKIAEMRTGEGKTLVATLPVALNALQGKGVHVITVNDYLAKRDAVWMGPVYHLLGLTVGSIQHDAAYRFDPEIQNADEHLKFLRAVPRKEAYEADITYGTNNEFGFDYLRDNMAPSAELRVQRGLHYAIVDEVDSILIDEARTPLIISAPSGESGDLYGKFSRIVTTLSEGTDYNVDEKMRASTLTQEGMTKVERALGISNIYSADGVEFVHHIEQALKAKALFTRDKDYVVRDGEVVIVDEFTGRLMFGRRYSEGLHQAIEAKEGVEVKQESRTLATITFQNYFRLYEKLAGMTGTAATEAEEFSKIYSLETIQIPTHRPMIRQDSADRVYKTERGKFQALVRDLKARHEKGQPVLIGTISIQKNELLSELLDREGIPFNVLNAKNHEREAETIAQAGKRGAVTVATNMAGRGVDIILGGNPPGEKTAAEIRELGGLHVIGTERHESRRIDNQLRGRSGRQGDPGSSQFYVSMEDDLLRIFGSDRLKTLMDRLGLPEDMPIENAMISRSIESAQKKVEGHNFDIRKHLVEYDDVMNKHREVVYRLRNEILDSPDGLRQRIHDLVSQEIEHVVAFHTHDDNQDVWDLNEIYEVIDTIFPVTLEHRVTMEDLRKQHSTGQSDFVARTAIINYFSTLAQRAYGTLVSTIGDSTLKTIERGLYLRSIDTLWIEHLDLMDHLRQGIGLRGYAQQDPLVEYKKEAFRLFTELMGNIQKQVVYTIFKVGAAKTVTTTPLARKEQPMNISHTHTSSFSQEAQNTSSTQTKVAPTPDRTPTGEKIGRNDPCYCGSGKKYKKCHGK